MTTTNSYICSKCGQEFDPPNHVCVTRPSTNANSTVNTGLYSHDIKAEIIAARDKWWVKTVDALMHEPPCYAPADEPCTELNCEVFPCTFMAWQQLKAKMGVKK